MPTQIHKKKGQKLITKSEINKLKEEFAELFGESAKNTIEIQAENNNTNG